MKSIELSHRWGSFRPLLECGVASRAKHYQGPEARLPTVKTRLRRNRSIDILL